MMPTTPIGTRTRSMVMPFGRVQRSATTPTGSARARTTSRPSAMAAMRRSSSARRSRKAAVAPAAFASATSLALAARISARRARIAAAIVDVDKPRGERVVGAIRGSSGEAELFIADVSKGSDVAALVRAVVDRFGRIDILVNNVAISDNKHIFDITEEEWDRVLAVTLKSQFLMGKHVAQQMAAQGTGGRIVNIGSAAGLMGITRDVAYAAAKGGEGQLRRG